MKSTVIATAFVSLLASCAAVGPDYERPQIELPDGYGAEIDGSAGVDASIATWWERFADPELDALVESVLASNLDLMAAVERIEFARAGLAASRGLRLPSASVDGSVSHAQPRGSSDSDEVFALGIGAAWELDVFGRVRRSVEASRADLGATVELARAVRTALVAETVATYLQVRSLQARLAIARNNVAGQAASLDIAQSRFDAGIASRLDPTQAEVNLAATRSAIPALELAIRRSAHRLAVLTGAAPSETPAGVLEGGALPAVPASLLVGVPADLLRNRPDVRAAERQLAAQVARIGLAEAARYPSFDLVGSFDLLAADLGDLFDDGSDAWSIGVPFSWPIFTGGRLEAAVHAERARARELELTYVQTVLIAQEEVENALVAYANDRETQRILASAVDAANRTVELSRELYTAGQSDFQNVLDAERSLFALEDDLEVARVNVLLDLVDLYRALGGGWAAAADGGIGLESVEPNSGTDAAGDA